MKLPITIHQTYRVERRVVIEINAATTEEACEMLASCEIEIPAFNDPRWTDVHTLEHEEYRPA